MAQRLRRDELGEALKGREPPVLGEFGQVVREISRVWKRVLVRIHRGPGRSEGRGGGEGEEVTDMG